MKTLNYVRIIRVGSMVVETKGQTRRCRKPVAPLQDGAWIEGYLIKPIRIGDEFHVRCLFHNGKACRRVYRSSSVAIIQGDQVLTYEVRYKVLCVPRFDAEKSLRAWE